MTAKGRRTVTAKGPWAMTVKGGPVMTVKRCRAMQRRADDFSQPEHALACVNNDFGLRNHQIG
jgi:hypothetical protein